MKYKQFSDEVQAIFIFWWSTSNFL